MSEQAFDAGARRLQCLVENPFHFFEVAVDRGEQASGANLARRLCKLHGKPRQGGDRISDFTD
jgi:hypothetical protein